MATGAEAETTVWRASRPLRAIFYSQIVMSGGCFAVAAVGVGEIIATVTLAVAWAVFVAVIWARGLRPRMTLTPETIEIRDYLNDATVALRDIASCRAGRDGMEITCVDGRVKLAPHPSKSLIAQWSGRRTAADEAAELIMARAEAARADPRPTLGRQEWWPFS